MRIYVLSHTVTYSGKSRSLVVDLAVTPPAKTADELSPFDTGSTLAVLA